MTCEIRKAFMHVSLLLKCLVKIDMTVSDDEMMQTKILLGNIDEYVLIIQMEKIDKIPDHLLRLVVTEKETETKQILIVVEAVRTVKNDIFA